jgi:Holliday junction resolvase
MAEADWQRLVIQALRALGWRVAHFQGVHVTRKNGHSYHATPVQADGAGFPDLIAVRGDRMLALELKREKGGKISQAQVEWIAAMSAIPGVQAGVYRPSDWDTIQDLMR